MHLSIQYTIVYNLCLAFTQFLLNSETVEPEASASRTEAKDQEPEVCNILGNPSVRPSVYLSVSLSITGTRTNIIILSMHRIPDSSHI